MTSSENVTGWASWPSSAPGAYYHLAWLTVGSTYVVMLLGAYTSAIGAGLSCPDWPTCYGTWVPFLYSDVVADAPYSALQIFAEWAHRGLAFATGFLILGTAVAAWRWQRDRSLVVWSATLALIFLPIQVFLGRLTVTQLLQPLIVTTHLGVATLILLLLLTSALTSWLLDRHSRASVGGTR